MSGAVAVGSVVVVLELGAPAASNLGLGLGTIPADQGAAVSQALNNPTVPSWGLAATSVAVTPSAALVAGAPTTPAATSSGPLTSAVSSVAPSSALVQPAVATTSGDVSNHVVAAPIATATVASTNNGGDTTAHANVLVDAPTSDHGVQSQDQQGGHGQNGQHGQGNGGQGNGAQGNGGQGNGNGGQGNGGSNVPQGRALGHSH